MSKRAQPNFFKNSRLLVVAIIAGFVAFGVTFGLTLAAGSGKDQAVCNEPCVRLSAAAAQPEVVTITAGSYVEFATADGKKHNLSLKESHGSSDVHGSTYSSGEFGKGELWRVQFKEDGTFTFIDSLNEKIQINVLVYTEGKDYKVN